MHPWALSYMLNLSTAALGQSQHPDSGFLFQAYGSPVKRTAAQIYHEFYSRGYSIAHNDNVFSVYAKANGGNGPVYPDPRFFNAPAETRDPKAWFELGQSQAWAGHCEGSLQSFIFAAQPDTQMPHLLESVRQVLSTDGLTISERLCSELGSLFDSDDFISSRLSVIATYDDKLDTPFLDVLPPVYTQEENRFSSRLTSGRSAINTECDLQNVLRVVQKITGTTDVRTDDEKFFEFTGVKLT